MLGIRASSGGSGGGGGGGGGFSMASLFAGGEKGAYYDFADSTKLAVNADGTGGVPALDAATRWAVDSSPNANHLRTNQGSNLPVRRANGLETSGAGYGLFNTTGFGDWPNIPEPYTVLCTLEQIAFAGSDSRIWAPSAANGSYLQGPTSGETRFYSGDYGPTLATAIGTEFTIELLSASSGRFQRLNNGDAVNVGVTSSSLDSFFLGASSGGSTPTRVRFKRMLVLGRALTSGERAGVVAWAIA